MIPELAEEKPRKRSTYERGLMSLVDCVLLTIKGGGRDVPVYWVAPIACRLQRLSIGE